jgi:hypothetical protein
MVPDGLGQINFFLEKGGMSAQFVPVKKCQMFKPVK